MRTIRNLLIIFLLVAFLWHAYGDTYKKSGIEGVVSDVRTDALAISEAIHLTEGIDWFNRKVQDLTGYVEEDLAEDVPPDQSPLPKPDLEKPAQQPFSILNIEMGDDQSKAEKEAGEPKRTSLNEYGSKWHGYHDHYKHFVMVSYNDNNQVNGLFTNQDLLTSTNQISFSSTQSEVRSELGDPLDSIQKGMIRYQMESGEEYDLFQIDDNYVTLFYDKQNDHTVTAIQIINEDLEKQKQAYYGKSSDTLKEGLEYQLFDLTNAARVKFGREPLVWGDAALETAQNHSKDMAVNDYFSHTNLQGQSPFDRMDEAQINYRTAGENLAAGQSSSIFAHQGLMNSPGHRENILKGAYKQLAVGLAFSDEDQPYYTETFWKK